MVLPVSKDEPMTKQNPFVAPPRPVFVMGKEPSTTAPGTVGSPLTKTRGVHGAEQDIDNNTENQNTMTRRPQHDFVSVHRRPVVLDDRMPTSAPGSVGAPMFTADKTPRRSMPRPPGGPSTALSKAHGLRGGAELAGPRGLSGGVARTAMYVVAPGDTTSGIAQKLGVTVPALLAANHGRPTMQLSSGVWVFKTLTEREKLNVPRGIGVLAAPPGMVGAGPGEECGALSWCDSGYHCENGVCVRDADMTPIQAGLSNEGSFCDAGGGPQSGYVQNGSCVPLGGNTAVGAQGSNTLLGNVVCPGPNMHPDWSDITSWACICDEGYTNDPNGPGCVPVGTPGTGGVGTQQFYEECMAVGGEIDPDTGACRAKGGVSGQGTQFKPIPGSGGTSGSPAGGGKANQGGGGKAGPTEPVDVKTGLLGSMSDGMKTALKVAAGVGAVALVGGGAYAIAKKRKDAKMKGKDKGGKELPAGKTPHKALPPKK